MRKEETKPETKTFKGWEELGISSWSDYCSPKDAERISEIIRRITEGVAENVEPKTITSFEIAGMFQCPHMKVFNSISKYLSVEASEDEKQHFLIDEREYRNSRKHFIWRLTEDGCKLYLERMCPDNNRGKYFTEGVKKLNLEIEERFHPKKTVNSILMNGRSRTECSHIKELFDMFITGPAIENREIKELAEKYEEFYKVLSRAKISGNERADFEDSVMGIAIEAEMQGFLYGFRVLEILAEKTMAIA